MTYTLIYGSNSVVRDSDGAVIPNSTTNSDWRIYQAWLNDGNAATPAATPPAAPIKIEAWQGIALMKSTSYDPSLASAPYQAIVSGKTNIYDALIALVEAANNISLTTYLEYGTSFTNTDTWVQTLATELGISSDEVNTLFSEAAALTI